MMAVSDEIKKEFRKKEMNAKRTRMNDNAQLAMVALCKGNGYHYDMVAQYAYRISRDMEYERNKLEKDGCFDE